MKLKDRIILGGLELKKYKQGIIIMFLIQFFVFIIVGISMILFDQIDSLFDQYYHNNFRDSYNVTLENFIAQDIDDLHKFGYENINIEIDNANTVKVFRNNHLLPNIVLQSSYNDEYEWTEKIIAGNDFDKKCENQYLGWLSEKAANDNDIHVGDQLTLQFGEQIEQNYTIAGIFQGNGSDLYVSFASLCSIKNIQNVLLFQGTAQIKSLSSYNLIVKYWDYLGKYVWSGELEPLTNTLFYIKGIFGGVLLVVILLFVCTTSNIYNMRLMERANYNEMLRMMGMTKKTLGNINSFVFVMMSIIALICAYIIDWCLLDRFNYILLTEFDQLLVVKDKMSVCFILIFFVNLFFLKWICNRRLKNYIE